MSVARSGINVLAVVMISVATAAYYSPRFMNADVVINSVMSLQHVTLFYWGQNRLLNVLPAAASLLQAPLVNLYYIIFLASLSHFCLLYGVSKIAGWLVGPHGDSQLAVKIFPVLVAAFLLMFNGAGIFEIVVWHVEYSLPAILVLMAFGLAYSGAINEPIYFILAALCVGIASGVNSAVFILSCFLCLGCLIVARQWRKGLSTFLLLSAIAFVSWVYVSKVTGGPSYLKFTPKSLPYGITMVSHKLIDGMSVLGLVALVGLGALIRIFFVVRGINFPPVARERAMAFPVVILFAVCWLILFSCNKWVEANIYSYRYFIWFFYCLILFVSIEIARVFIALGRRCGQLVSGVTGAILIAWLFAGAEPLEESSVFREVFAVAPSYHGFYAGDYWFVWPRIWIDAVHGRSSYGFAYRAEGNREKVNELVNHQLAESGKFQVLCVKAKMESCMEQVSAIVGTVALSSMHTLDPDATELWLMR